MRTCSARVQKTQAARFSHHLSRRISRLNPSKMASTTSPSSSPHLSLALPLQPPLPLASAPASPIVASTPLQQQDGARVRSHSHNHSSHGHDHGHEHHHHGAPSSWKRFRTYATSRQGRITSMLVLTGSYFFVELIVGTLTGSLALVADAWHMLSDVLSLVVGLVAIMLAARRTFGSNFSYGWARAEVLGALVNGVFLLALCLTIFIDAIQRYFKPELIENPKQVLIVGGIGLGINIAGLFLFHEHGHAHGGHDHGHDHGHGAHDHAHGHSEKQDDDDAMSTTSMSSSARPGTPVLRNGSSVETLPMASPLRAADMAELAIPPVPTSDRIDGVRVTRVGARVSIDARSLHTSEDTGDISALGDIESRGVGNDADMAAADLEATKGHGGHSHGGHSHADLNMRGLLLHVMGDALGSIAVMISAGIAWGLEDSVTGEVPRWVVYLDPTVSVLITVVLLAGTIPLVRSAATVLLQVAPYSLDVSRVRARLGTIPGVLNVHELHIWQLDMAKTVATVHVGMDPAAGYERVAASIKRMLHRVGVHSTTVQPEFVIDNGQYGTNDPCMFRCPDKTCGEATCCQ
ncbi:cation efflux family-domain-containing protein [Blastocladiella britannica]|nr:cation efflux family-domain-containing protein [Blastocladiella britannica]